MKICYVTYPSAFQNIGGGEIQLLKTREYVEKMGVPIHLFDLWKDRVEDFDILHIFSSVKDCLSLACVARSRGVKVVTSPVLWSDWHRAIHTDGSLGEKASLVARHAAKVIWPAFPSSRRKLLLESDLILPNSDIEKKQIESLFKIPAASIRVVYNGVEKRFLSANPDLYRKQQGSEPFLLSVGRIEPRKNQLNLIRALKPLGKKLVLIGSPVSGYEDYYRQCFDAGRGFVQFLPTMGHEEPFLMSAYAACDLFILPGWFETPGLAALEAVLAGARVVVTRGGSTREYFESEADYLDPADPADIRRQVLANAGQAPNERLRKRVLENFTWERIAESTVSAYRQLLA